MDSIISNLNDLVSYRANKIVPFKKQIEILEEKLLFLRSLLKLGVNYEELGEFKVFVQAFANDAACLTFLYWAKDADAQTVSETNSMLSHTLQKIKPSTPDVSRLYFGVLVSVYVQRSDSHIFGQTAFSFVDFFLEDPVPHLKNDFQFLQDNIIFLLTFLNDPPNHNVVELICSQIDVLFWESLYDLLPFDDKECDFSAKKYLLSDFMVRIEAINSDIRHTCSKFPDSALYNFPQIVSPHFLDFVIRNLRNLKDRMISDRKYAPFAKYWIIKIEKELVSLCPFFIQICDLQSELNETWLEVVNLVYLIEHVIMSYVSSWFVFDHPIWYYMAYLSDVFDEIKSAKAKLEKIKKRIIYNARCLPNSTGFISELAEGDRPLKFNETFVGFEDEVEKIIGMLTRGTKSLDIVSIVGMGGLGKTTLAKKVCESSSIKCNFDVFGFCSVSPDYNTRRLLLDILRDIKEADHITPDTTNDDLAHELWKHFSRQKYLIVLDDIWDARAWNEIKSSFPDDKNGSRVLFTTRSHEVANKCRINCIPHQLRFLSEDESWKILQKKVFLNGLSLPYLHEIGKQIAKNCKGLALAVAVIAGLLARTEKSTRWWSEVAERLVCYLSDEGCMEILDLSYKHLPEYLKPCLLYFGAFREDRLIKVKHVTSLWIAEGFVQESKTKCIEDVAKEYFHILVDRSFIIVSARSSRGGIKTFGVHDLIRDLCQKKCRDGKFFQLNHNITSSISSDPCMNNHYRVSTQNERDVTTAAGSSLSNARTVHLFSEDEHGRMPSLSLKKLALVQVLDLDLLMLDDFINQLIFMIHLRYIDFTLFPVHALPSSLNL